MSSKEVPPADVLPRLIAEELKALRARRGFTLDELVVAVNNKVSRSTIHRIEKMESEPTFEQATFLARAMGLDLPRLVQRVFDNYHEELGQRP